MSTTAVVDGVLAAVLSTGEIACAAQVIGYPIAVAAVHATVATATWVQLKATVVMSPYAIGDEIFIRDGVAFAVSPSLTDVQPLTDQIAISAGKTFSDVIVTSDAVAFTQGPVVNDTIVMADVFTVTDSTPTADVAVLSDVVALGVNKGISELIPATDALTVSTSRPIVDTVVAVDAFTWIRSDGTLDGAPMNWSHLN